MTQAQVSQEYQQIFEFDEDTDILEIEMPKMMTGRKIHIPKKIYAKQPESSSGKTETLCGRTGRAWRFTFDEYRDNNRNVYLKLCRHCTKQASKILGFDVREYIKEAQGGER